MTKAEATEKLRRAEQEVVSYKAFLAEPIKINRDPTEGWYLRTEDPEEGDWIVVCRTSADPFTMGPDRDVLYLSERGVFRCPNSAPVLDGIELYGNMISLSSNDPQYREE